MSADRLPEPPPALPDGRSWRARTRDRVAGWLRIYRADEPIAAEFRAQQIRAVLKLTPLTMLANVLNVTIVDVTFWQLGSHMYLVAWSAIVLWSALVGFRPWLAMQTGQAPRRASPRALRRALRRASELAVLWASLPAVLFPQGDSRGQLVVAVVSCGMICAGGFALATLPAAATTYVIILAIGVSIGFVRDGAMAHWDLLFLLVLYSLIVIGSVMASSRTFGARLMAEANATRQQQLVGLLLNDFEAHSSDWLWEIDADGQLGHVSERLAQMLGQSAATLRGARLVDLLKPPNAVLAADEEESLQRFNERLRQPQHFRDLPVAVCVGDDRRWWALTANPLFNEVGEQVGWRGVGSDITHARRAEVEMRRLANVDSLTGLANRHQFRARLAMVQSLPNGASSQYALLYMDLDHFKNINDSLGHAAGDRVLQIAARRLQACVRHDDVLARLGGDEFALLSLDRCTAEAAAALAQRILDEFGAPSAIDGVNVQLSSSIGIALAPDDGSDPETLLRSADMALYAAKAAGRHTYRFFEREMDERAKARLTIQGDLRQALELGQFELHFQPQIHLESRRLKGFEALLRWHHPVQGWLPPQEFIPIAEESGLIVPIGAWVLQKSCELAARWPGSLRLAVNVSAAQFAHTAGIAEVVADALARSGLTADRLELEITESLLLDDNSATRSALAQLRARGVRIALDDFGTGYSSLAYFRHFPLDTLKIDRSFVRSLAEDPNAHALVCAIIGMARALSLGTTAEGVETWDEFNALREIGCTDAQGFLIAKPMPAAQLGRFLHDWESGTAAVVPQAIASEATTL